MEEYINKMEEVVNEGKIGKSSHQNQRRFPENSKSDRVATKFSRKGEAGKNILSKSEHLIPISLQYLSNSYREEWRTVLS